MKNLMKRCMALLLVLFLCLSLLPVTQVSAGVVRVEYVYDSTGKYIYNWGTRGTTATYLSQNASAFYTGSNSYDSLAALSGGTSKDDAPSSSLYAALKNLMAGAHSYKTSYDATRSLYQYTDCQNSGGKISSFYSGKEIGPDWDSGATWNREHTWPNSKGLGGSDENDIMMLRPTQKDENGARGNKAYGQSSGYYYPNSESNGALDLRGDVARIFLYVYVRWGNVNGNGEYDTWGTRGVIESPEVLLLWMQEDPVDTWELGRNDSVQSITGTRNVFVDYPEFAFLLFGQDVPNNMTTPSGEAHNATSCQHNYVPGTVVLATCTTDGYTVYTCSLCSKSYQGDKVAASHSFVNGTCTACGEIAYGVVETPVPGTAYKFGMIQENKSKTDVYYLKGGMDGYYMATSTDKTAAIDVYLEQTEGGYYFYTLSGETKQYINMVVSGTHVNGAYEATASTVYTYDATSKTLIAQVNGTPYWFGTRNDKTYTTVGPCATSYNGFYCQFYGDLNQPGDPECKHSNTTVIGAKAATCTEDGHTGKTLCSDCGQTISEGQVIAASGHSFVNGTCTACGKQESEQSALVAGKAYKFGMTQANVNNAVCYLKGGMEGYYMATTTDVSAAIDVYVEETTGGYYFYTYVNGVKTYINMVVSGTHVNGAYEATASTVYTYDATNDTLIAIVNGTEYWFGTRNDKTYTTMGPCAVSYQGFMGQFYELNAPACEHTNTKLEGAKDATCTEDGHTGKTMCSDCGATVNAGSVIPATGHNFVDGTCSACGEKKPTTSVTTATISFADKAQRTEYSTTKQVWVQNGITVTNEKASSTSNVGDYAKPGRFYKGSSLKIEYPGMTKIEIDCSGLDNKYVTPYTESITDPNATVTINNKIVTVTFAQPVDSLVISKLSAQVRANSITVTAEAAEPACEHTETKVEGDKAATCTEDGHTGKTVCSDCGETISEGSVIPATGHNFVDGTCTKCGEADPDAAPEQPGETSSATYIMSEYKVSGEMGGGEHVRDLDENVRFTISSGWFTTEARIYKNANGVIESKKPISSLVLNAGYKTSTFDVYTSEDGVTWTKHSNQAYTSGYGDVTINFETPVKYIKLDAPNAQLRIKTITVNFAGAAPEEPACEHTNVTVEGAKAATCTEDGHTGKITCTDCGEVTDEGEVVKAPGHNYVDHFCSGCGQMDPEAPKYDVYFLVPNGVSAVAPMVSDPNGITLPTAGTIEGYTFLGWVANAVDNATEQVEYLKAGDKYVAQQNAVLYALYRYEKTTVVEPTSGTANISFASTAQRTEFTSTKQVWEQNGITVTNLKASSSSAVANYSNPARFYAGSSLQIEYPGMTKIEFTCNSNSYASDLKNSITGATVSINGKIVTVTFNAPQDSFQIAKLSKQVRMNSIQVTYSTPGSQETVTYYTTVIGDSCTHSNAALGSKDATCTESGYKDALVCSDCNAVLSGEVIAALGHEAGAEATCETAQICTRCEEVLAAALGHEAGAEATCETAQTCTRCDYVFVAALGHEAGAEATCETAQTCTRCSHVLVEALGHEAGAEATCETAQICTRCEEVLVAALGHEAGAEATCETAQTCTRCDYVFAAALGHEAGAEATCETAQTCTRCDHVFVEALGHDGGAEATCETAQICTRCDQVIVEALGHKAGAKATCKTAQTCTRCDYVYEPALGHDIVKYAAKEPTCTSAGWKAYEACSRCSYSTYSGIAAKGHSYQSVVTKPTCTEEGFTTNTCSVCGDVSKSNTVDALGHKLSHMEAKDATTEAEGNIEYWSCETCQGMWTDEACTKSTTKEATVLPKQETPATDATTEATTDPITDTTTIGSTDDKNEDSKTPTVLWGGLIVLAVLAVVILLGIKKFGKK